MYVTATGGSPYYKLSIIGDNNDQVHVYTINYKMEQRGRDRSANKIIQRRITFYKIFETYQRTKSLPTYGGISITKTELNLLPCISITQLAFYFAIYDTI